ncbi:MAG: UvrB/UvrC motif-containing protein [Clostridia bacterium]|nr:UvrB/UvrC motif-containing protein [Clostridia bacterium]
MNLCADCAEDVQSSVAPPVFDGFGSLLSGLAGLENFWGASVSPQVSKNVKTCPVCKSTIKTINQTGKLGCSECYVTFIDELRPLLRKIHGNAVHIGATPYIDGEDANAVQDAESINISRGRKTVSDKAAETNETVKDAAAPAEEKELTEIEKLRIEMKEAIEKEDFEKAAEIRDKIKSLDKEGGEND